MPRIKPGEQLNLQPSYRKPRMNCRRCGDVHAIVGRGLCARCYDTVTEDGTRGEWLKLPRVCGEKERRVDAVGAPKDSAPGLCADNEAPLPAVPPVPYDRSLLVAIMAAVHASLRKAGVMLGEAEIAVAVVNAYELAVAP